MNLFIWLGNKIGGWLGGPPHDPRGMLDEAWRNEPYKYTPNSQEWHDAGELALIKISRAQLQRKRAEAVRKHKAVRHIDAQLQDLTARQLRLESDIAERKRLWECG